MKEEAKEEKFPFPESQSSQDDSPKKSPKKTVKKKETKKEPKSEPIKREATSGPVKIEDFDPSKVMWARLFLCNFNEIYSIDYTV